MCGGNTGKPWTCKMHFYDSGFGLRFNSGRLLVAFERKPNDGHLGGERLVND